MSLFEDAAKNAWNPAIRAFANENVSALPWQLVQANRLTKSVTE